MIRNPGSFNNLNTQINNILTELNELAQPGYAWRYVGFVNGSGGVYNNSRIPLQKTAISIMQITFYASEVGSITQNLENINPYNLSINQTLLIDGEMTLKVKHIGKKFIELIPTGRINYTDNKCLIYELIPIEKKTSAN